MSLYQDWQDLASQERSQNEYQNFWAMYFEKEKNVYQSILSDHKKIVKGSLSELAEKYSMENHWMVGYIDGINTSLNKAYEIDKLEEDTQISLDIDFEKLLFNMHSAKADWLYDLTEWDNILPIERRAEIEKDFKRSLIAISNKIGRNDDCNCGSGKKYKKCCGK